jgi:hypothetical protein
VHKQVSDSRRQIKKKTMRKLLPLFLLASALVSAQKVTFIEKNDTLQKPEYQEWIFLTDSTDLSESVKVATIKSVGSLKNPLAMVKAIRPEALKLGANSYKFVSFTKGENQTGELVLTAYYTPGNILSMNFQSIPKNKVYIFGDDDLTGSKTQTYKVNGEKQEISTGQYKSFTLKFGEETKISKGGLTGMAVWVAYDNGKTAKFYSFSGIGIAGGGASVSSYGSGVSVGITTGRIHPVEQSTALLLMKIYEEKK